MRGSISVVLLDQNKGNIKCVDVWKIKMSESAKVRNKSRYPFF
jgi:hypothetical protein